MSLYSSVRVISEQFIAPGKPSEKPLKPFKELAEKGLGGKV